MDSVYQELSIDLVELDVENPRIKMYLENYKTITAEGIALALNSSSSDGATSFSSLRESIKVNKGIINPILVNHQSDGRYVVIEGNTRLQIYKDFREIDKDGPWNIIRCIVYEKLTQEEIHAIRLQCHLVGPRDWDPYSKAKYLNQLSNIDKLPMSTIISYCGGKRNEIVKLINAYADMQSYYMPKVKELGYDFDNRDFSKYAELQNRAIIDALAQTGFTKQDFTKWVINKNIDTAQNVRLLPQILRDKSARDEFFKTNITEAYKKINISNAASVDLNSIPYDVLSQALLLKMKKMEFEEFKKINNPKEEEGRSKKALLASLVDAIQEVIEYSTNED